MDKSGPAQSKKIKIVSKDLPYVVSVGEGGKESGDFKVILKPTITNIHYTMSLKFDQQNNLFGLNLHITNEKKKQEAIQEGKNTKGAYELLTNLVFSYNVKALEENKLLLNERAQELFHNNIILVDENHPLPKGKIIPLGLFEGQSFIEFTNIKTNKKIQIVDGEKLTKFVEKIQSVEDLEINGYTKGLIKDTEGNYFVVFKNKNEGKWYYLNIIEFIRGLFSIFSPYIDIKGEVKEGEITKEKFINQFK
jgi:hypothetical protein